MSLKRQLPEPAILISQHGSDSSFRDVERHLLQRGYRTFMFEGSAFDDMAEGRVEALRDEIDAVWVVHSSDIGSTAFDRELARASQTFGPRRVGVLSEWPMPDVASGSGHERISFERGRAGVVADQLVASLVQMGVAGESGVHRRLRATQNSRFSSGLTAPMVMLLLTLSAAVVAGLYVTATQLRGDDASEERVLSGDSGLDEAATQLEVQEGVLPDVFGPVDQAPAIGGATAETGAGLEASGGSGTLLEATPSGPAAGLSADRNLIPLPDTCLLDLRKEAVLPVITGCAQGGLLELQGPQGPWHNDVGQIIISQGVVGSLNYEGSSADVVLGEGIHQLDLSRSRYGLQSLQLTFTGEGQHIHFVQAADRGSAELTLTFRFGP